MISTSRAWSTHPTRSLPTARECAQAPVPRLLHHNADALATAAVFRAHRGAFLAALDEVPLDEAVRRRAAAYLEGFFSDIADDQRTASKLLKTCVR